VTLIDANDGTVIWEKSLKIAPMKAEEGVEPWVQIDDPVLSEDNGFLFWTYLEAKTWNFILDLKSFSLRVPPLSVDRSTENFMMKTSTLDLLLGLHYHGFDGKSPPLITASYWSGSSFGGSYKAAWSFSVPSPCGTGPDPLQYGVTRSGYLVLLCINTPGVVPPRPGSLPQLFSLDLKSGSLLSNSTFTVPENYVDTSYEVTWFGKVSGDHFALTISSYTETTQCKPQVLVYHGKDVSSPILEIDYLFFDGDAVGFYDWASVTESLDGKLQLWMTFPGVIQFNDATVYYTNLI
jgi:hypothetical protein